MTDRISPISDFMLHLDALKSVNRRTYINRGERVENSAEHSWHLAMACWAFAELLEDDYDVPKLIKFALLHDLGEIGAGDTFLYSNDRDSAHIEERESVKQIASHPGNPIEVIVELWEEQEAGEEAAEEMDGQYSATQLGTKEPSEEDVQALADELCRKLADMQKRDASEEDANRVVRDSLFGAIKGKGKGKNGQRYEPR